uniref:Uncharacterized protein AlNc14C72G4933 n=1 Tax=Albugo laibachii Nc14 TaxID=890382 RepID=F0WE77_9STRA|nr:conserved hypothetical protein [Albugo laibachii Nc14]|eukprot:CCA19506.1 conserved hypothetical protein [Albugo laibachii Nc14]
MAQAQERVVEFRVGMTCEECSSACTQILEKIEGVSNVKCDIEKKQILVTGTADPNVMLQALAQEKVVEFKVGMTCGGCSSACTRILQKNEGVTDVKCDLDKKQILVTGNTKPDAMLQALKNWSVASKKDVELISVTPRWECQLVG